MGCTGTKFSSGPYEYQPKTLAQLYAEIYAELNQQPFKPVPGDEYRKCYKPKNGQTDGPTFKRFPQEIIITQPPRLFRSRAWKYRGQVHGESEACWEFQCKFYNPLYENFGKTPIVRYERYTGYLEYNRGWEYIWLPVFILSNCYISATISFKRSNYCKQLTLF